MMILYKKLAIFGASMALIAAPSFAQMRVAPLEEVYESYNDCFAATANGVDTAALQERGWTLATIDGEPTSEPRIFGHRTRAPLVLLSGTGRDGICIVTARLENRAAFDRFISAWDGLKLVRGEATFMAEGHPVQIAQTGSRKEPSVRLVVGVPSETK